MKDRHIHIEEDSDLLKQLRKATRSIPLERKRYRWVMTAKFVVFLGLAALCYLLMINAQQPIQLILAYIGIGLFLLLFAFNFAHDLSHSTVFKSPRWNDLGFISIYTLLGAHAEAWKYRHVHSHHFAPNVDGYDTDLEITSLIRVIPGSPWRKIHRYQHLYAPLAYMTYSLYWVLIKDPWVYASSFRSHTLSYHISFWIQKVVYFGYMLILPLLFSPLSPDWVVLGFLLMHASQSVFLLFTFFMTHHVVGTLYPGTSKDGIIQTSWFMNQIGSSNDMHPFSETANFFLGGFNNHIAHHLFPHIHHFHYPKLNRIIYPLLLAKGIEPNQTTYLGGVLSHLQALKELSTEGS